MLADEAPCNQVSSEIIIQGQKTSKAKVFRHWLAYQASRSSTEWAPHGQYIQPINPSISVNQPGKPTFLFESDFLVTLSCNIFQELVTWDRKNIPKVKYSDNFILKLWYIDHWTSFLSTLNNLAYQERLVSCVRPLAALIPPRLLIMRIVQDVGKLSNLTGKIRSASSSTWVHISCMIQSLTVWRRDVGYVFAWQQCAQFM